ncbi:MAG: hypothetical protein GEU71_00655 [Actinobacteria bacterium]|nr:hypothetical protein [Actinomycetota bacterium]
MTENRTSTFRRLWQPPARFEDRASDRRVTFLELFFDLVFVVVLAQLAHRLAEHPSWSGVGWFVFLFYAMWSSWINGTLYHDLHTTNDVSVRIFTFGQMLAVAIMAVYVGDVPGNGADGFALAYATNGFILTILWFRTGLHDPTHRPASVPYSSGYFASALLFAASVGFEQPAQYRVWAAALLLEVVGYVIASFRWTPPATQQGDANIAMTPSLIERIGLFMIIVLGEVVAGAVNGMAAIKPLELNGVTIGILGMLVAIGLWWIYFDLVSHRPPVSRLTQIWVYVHLPLVIAIGAGGAGVLNTIEHVEEPLPDTVRWLLVGSLAAALVSMAIISQTLEERRVHRKLYSSAQKAMVTGAVVALVVGTTGWGAKASLTAMAVLLLLPIAVGTAAWLRIADSTFEESDGRA